MSKTKIYNYIGMALGILGIVMLICFIHGIGTVEQQKNCGVVAVVVIVIATPFLKFKE